jgi:hypothetical protein
MERYGFTLIGENSMPSIILRQEVKDTKTVEYVKQPLLRANKCDCCGFVFQMDKWCNDSLTPAKLFGTFDTSNAFTGNMFDAIVCSFRCAHILFFQEEWKTMEKYKSFADIGAKLVRVELGLTSLIKDEKQLIEEWENTAHNQTPDYIILDKS